jgi:hypothetical protein
MRTQSTVHAVSSSRAPQHVPPEPPGHVASNAWKFAAAAAVAPLLAGLTVILTTWVNAARPSKPWWTGVGTLGFSFHGIGAAGTGSAAFLQTLGSVGGVNIVGGAVAVVVVSRFGLREGRAWAWWTLAFFFGWVGLHDLFMAVRFLLATGQPLAVFPAFYCAMLATALVRSRGLVRQRAARSLPVSRECATAG